MRVVSEDDAARGDVPHTDHFMLFSANLEREGDRHVYSVEGPAYLRDRRGKKSDEEWLKMLNEDSLPELPFIALNSHGRLNEVP